MNREIRQFHRRVNYTSASASRLKCEHSLAHSLRIEPPTKAKRTKKIEWDEDLTMHNLIWINGAISPLDSWSEEERLELLYRTVPVPRIRNQTKLQTQRRQYRLKIKRAIDSERRKGHEATASFLDEVIETAGYISYSKIDRFTKLPMQRRNQRVRMLETYLNAHNQLHQVAPTHNVYMQEGIFKVPHQWGVGSDVLSLEEYMALTAEFLTHYFPEYKIKLIVGHDDERKKTANTGCHPHYFLSGLNRETGQYDLHKRQIQVVNSYIEQRYQVKHFFSLDSELSREESRDYGFYFQEMVREFTNERLFNRKGLQVEFAPETERRSQQRKLMNREAKLAKSERSHNYYTHQAELALERLEQAEKRCVELNEANTMLEAQFSEILDEVVQAQAQLSQLQVERDSAETEVLELQSEANRLFDLTQELSQDVVSRLVGIFRKVVLALNARDNNMRQKQSEYLISIAESALNLPPSMTKIITDEVSSIEKSGNESDLHY